ncbi:MAG: diguanylate cyclase [Candidatus Omnitrophica bacterium]|nr:diguanylate cyclase [Candidatus Omnitrophota bacterium]
MGTLASISVMPSKLRYKLLTAFCLMSLVPILVGVYIASLFIKFPFEVNPVNLATISLVVLFSLTLSFLGYQITKQMVSPIASVALQAKNIAAGNLVEEATDVKGSEELEDLSKSLKEISKNARDLLNKVEKLSQKDKLTGLYNAAYIRERLEEEILRSIHYQRPCSFAYFAVDGLSVLALKYGEITAEEAIKSIAGVLNKNLSEFDRAARVAKDDFAIIIADKNKKKAIETVEAIAKEISEFAFIKEEFREAIKLGLFVGISENPIDGITADELYIKATTRARSAMIKGNLIEAFA